jgi:hypothetical protein
MNATQIVQNDFALSPQYQDLLLRIKGVSSDTLFKLRPELKGIPRELFLLILSSLRAPYMDGLSVRDQQEILAKSYPEAAKLVADTERTYGLDPFFSRIGLISELDHRNLFVGEIDDDDAIGLTLNERRLVVASKYGFINIVRLLLSDPNLDPSAGFNRAISMAYVEILSDNSPIPIVDMTGKNNIILRLAEDPRVDPSANYNEPINILATMYDIDWSIAGDAIIEAIAGSTEYYDDNSEFYDAMYPRLIQTATDAQQVIKDDMITLFQNPRFALDMTIEEYLARM